MYNTYITGILYISNSFLSVNCEVFRFFFISSFITCNLTKDLLTEWVNCSPVGASPALPPLLDFGCLSLMNGFVNVRIFFLLLFFLLLGIFFWFWFNFHHGAPCARSECVCNNGVVAQASSYLLVPQWWAFPSHW